MVGLFEALLSRKDSAEIAVKYWRNRKWHEMSWVEYSFQCAQVGAALSALGNRESDRVAIMANTRPEWAWIDIGTLALGAVVVPIYVSSTPDEIQFILNDSGTTTLFLEDPLLLEKWWSIEEQCPMVRHLVVIDSAGATSSDPELAEKQGRLKAKQWGDFLHQGAELLKVRPNFLQEEGAQRQAEDLVTIAYTSGTTGVPKGVKITHHQVAAEVRDISQALFISSSDLSLTFLPFSHLLGRVEHWAHVYSGFTMAYAESLEKIADNLKVIRPTILVGVPRIFEKLYSRIRTKAAITPMGESLLEWSISVAGRISECYRTKRPVDWHLVPQYQVAKRLVLDRVPEGLGGRLRVVLCGGAPLNKELAEFFHSCGLLLLEGYGLTETTAAISCNTPFAYKFGTVGKPFPGVEIRIADDGEIWVRGGQVMVGYHNYDESGFVDGFFPTGDIGHFDEEGFLTITDRKKDLIKTAGGKYVAPQKIEGVLKRCPYISQVLVHGDHRKHIVALITLDPNAIKNFADEQGIKYQDLPHLARNPKIRTLIRLAVADANSQLASFETVKNFLILPREFSLEEGELTASLKIKRKFCDQKYRAELDRLYPKDPLHGNQ